MNEAAPDLHHERGTVLNRVARPALALGAGALVALSLPPWGWWPLSFVGVILFEVAIASATGRSQRARTGWMFGAGWMFLGMGWMIQLTAPGYIVAGAIFAGYHAAAAAVAPDGRWGVVGRPAAHALGEALRFAFPFGGVPLASLGIAQVSGPFAGVARIGGVIALTWLVFQFGALLAQLATRQPSQHSAARSDTTAASPAVSAAAATALVAMIALSFVAPSGSDTGESLRIAAVQGGGDQGTRATDVASRVVTDRHLEATESIAIDPALDLVFWPENTIDVTTFDDSEIADLITEQSERLGVPIAVGLTEDVIVDDERRYTNAQVVIAPDGEVTSRYDKVRRVPFGEYVPLRSVLEHITSAVDQVGEAIPGTTPAYLDLPGGQRAATVISWEVFFGGRAREGVALGAQLVLNPTNGASYTGTIVQTQQVASSQLRAIETGRWVVQAAPTGFTAVIDADGNVIERTSQVEQRVITHDIPLRTGTTWYVQLGDRPFIILLLAALLLSRTAMLRSRRAQPSDAPAVTLPAPV